MYLLRKGPISNQRGFTLLEMMIVISIVGVLAAVAVPRFTNVLSMANTARVQSDLQVLNSAIVLYQAENGTYPTEIGNLANYVENIDSVKPPKGTCQLRDGTTVTVTAAAYALTADGKQATCQGKTIGDFGRKDTANGQ